MQKSLWANTITLPKYKKLDGDIKTDVLVIGGGICGILCAYFLKTAGVDCILVEKRQITQGTTCNTTGKITVQHGLIYDYIIQHFGKETAQKYYMANNTAIKYYEELCKNIDCDFKKITSYTYSMNRAEKIENEINNYRAQLKNQNVVDVNNKEYDYQMGVHYMDLIGECEKLGDYVVNVVEARTNVKEKKVGDNR